MMHRGNLKPEIMAEVPGTCGLALIVRTVCSGRNKLLLTAVTAVRSSGE
jgi:hypothetical protein